MGIVLGVVIGGVAMVVWHMVVSPALERRDARIARERLQHVRDTAARLDARKPTA